MSNNPLVSLEKKKCRCGELAKIFFISSLPLEPGWFAVNAYINRDEKKHLPIIPHPFSQSELRFLSFFTVCDECGSVSQWVLSKEELDALYETNIQELGYRLVDLTNLKWVESVYKDYGGEKMRSTIIEIAKSIQSPGTKNETP